MNRTSVPSSRGEVSSFSKMAQKESGVNVVLFGNASAVHFGPENLLLGQEEPTSDISQIVPITKTLSGRHVSVINVLGLEEMELSPHIQHQFISGLLQENQIHAFIFTLQLGRVTHMKPTALEWLKKSFGEGALTFAMILFTYEKEEECDTVVDDLKENTLLEQLTSQCWGGYHTCSKSMNNQSEVRALLEKIDVLVSDNNQRCYTADTYNTTHRDPQTYRGDVTTSLQQQLNVSEEKKKPHPVCASAEDGTVPEEKENVGISKPKQIFHILNLNEKLKHKMKMSAVFKISRCSLHWKEPCKENDLLQTFLQRILMVDYRARYITTEVDSSNSEQTYLNTDDDDDDFAEFLSEKSAPLNSECNKYAVHPMDVQMAVFLCSDHFLKQLIVNKLAQCRYALPLLVPNPFTKEIEFPLWTFHQIQKSWKTTDAGAKISKTQAMSEAETPMVAFFRLGSVSSSKSQLMNSLINEKHHTFFHRHCPGSSKNRLLLDGVVEIAWYCPSGEEADYFSDCVAFCNLHGDAIINKEQLKILTETSSVNVVLISDRVKGDNKEIIQKLFRDHKPLICLISDHDSGVTVNRKEKYKIGLKDRNQSDVAKKLRNTIKECLSKSPLTFRIKDLHKAEVITKDEDDPECKRGKEAAEITMSHLEGIEVSELKKMFLPCQGKFWHDWCEMNKELHCLHGDNLEMQKCEKQKKMKELREEQHRCRMSAFMKSFTSSLNQLEENERLFFVKWVEILLDKRTTNNLSDLQHKYNEKWTEVLDLKKKHDKSDQIKMEQNQLEEISEKLNAATFGLEHILREMGQIYESFISVQTPKPLKENTFTSLPTTAAELMKSGHPLELMDGDAAHVPLIWVSAVLDELVKILGDKKMFVLSVLGIQSSGKSTLLNAMFGLQFAVSAGRCTRGAFMQLVSVSEEMKKDLKFDYILVVDTEGLRALELAGKSTRRHDNELSTFVVGLGNMTLINIFGENPAEMQDILQIVVQAFLRMKTVKLHPKCLFVHQNVGDVAAGDKNMEGRRRLLEQLDEMAKLAAKEQEVEADGFSDVIEFDVKNDVYYFAQLWEGSPPMAPPNPSYSRNIQDVKNAIFRKASLSSCITLSQFKSRVQDLWKALLNENFVFSFKNTLEIAVYRKLENEFGRWTWTLRSAMLVIEENLYNRMENEKPKKIEEAELYSSMKETKEEVDESMKSYFEEDEDKEILIQWRSRYNNKITQLYEDLVKDTKLNVNEVIQQQHTRLSFELQSTQKDYDTKLFNMSKDLALTLKSEMTNEHALKEEFDKLWDNWFTVLTRDIPPERTFNFWEDAKQILPSGNEITSVHDQFNLQNYKHICKLPDYSDYISNVRRQKLVHYVPGKHKLSFEDNEVIRTLVIDGINKAEGLVKTICKKIARVGYKNSFIQEITGKIRERVEQHHGENRRIKFNKKFTLDLCLYVCELMNHRFTEHHQKFRDTNDPRIYLPKKKPHYYSVFKNYCRGASAVNVFSEMICSSLKESVLQAVYNNTAIGLVSAIRSDMPEFNSNRSYLEKHILKCLAEEEDFEKYKEYIHHPKNHFELFIREKVQKYVTENSSVLNLFKRNLQDKKEKVKNAVYEATEEVKRSCGDAETWLRTFTSSLTDDLSLKKINFTDLQEITDFDFLQKLVSDGLEVITSELDKSFNCVKDIDMEKFRKKPDEILIEHLCKCCWVQCPFCKAICTHTMEDHDGDHSVPFHRVNGVRGWHYRDTTYLTSGICTTVVQSNKSFYPSVDEDLHFPYKLYRTAGGVYATWSITPDNTELVYWKWFVCRFQKDLEKFYEKTFEGSGEIPSDWKNFNKHQAIESLDQYI